MNGIDLQTDADGIATLRWGTAGGAECRVSEAWAEGFAEAVDAALGNPAVRGLLLTSGTTDFLSGTDLGWAVAIPDVPTARAWSARLQAALRRMERGGKPVAAALNGSALGPGMEIALACHHRVAADNPRSRFGFPEVRLGLPPGAGGTQRLPRLIGLRAALPLLLDGTELTATEAQAEGLVHSVVPAGEEEGTARAWLLDALSNDPPISQPWDTKGFRIPRGGPGTPENAQRLMLANAQVAARTRNALPAPRHILASLYEGLNTDIDTGLRVESAHYAAVAAGPEAKNLIRTLHVGLTRARRMGARPPHVPARSFVTVGVIGGGPMGAGIASVAALAGLDVVLVEADIDKAAAARGRVETLLAVRLGAESVHPAALAAPLARVKATDDQEALRSCQLVIEAVPEDRIVKTDVIVRAGACLAPATILATNTSTLPVTGLARACADPSRFIGLHFFSPALRMPLVEVVLGSQTSYETLAGAMDFVRAIGKTPVVVRDGRGFYASRVCAAYLAEGMAMLEEGVSPARIERAGLQAGMPVGPLTLADDLSLALIYRIALQSRADLTDHHVETAAERVADRMLHEAGRSGSGANGGFHEVTAKGVRLLWPGLTALYPTRPEPEQPGLEALIERLLLIQSLEAARALDEGVIQCAQDADIAAHLGWGFPAYRGGPLGWLHTLGLPTALQRCEALAREHGERFKAPKLLTDMAASGRSVYDA